MFFSADRPFCVIFGSILAYAPLFLFWEPFNISPWKGVQMFLVLLWWSIHFFWHHVHLCWGPFWGIFGPIFSCSSISWELCNILLWNCVHMCLVVLCWFHSAGGRAILGVFFILAYFGIYIFLYFLKTVQYFLIKFCIDVIGITQVTTTLKR